MPDTATAPAVIFFDLDDTLLDDRAASDAGLRTLMDRLGHPDYNAARTLWEVQTEISFGAYIDGRMGLQEQRRERVRALAVQAGHSSVPDQACDDLYRQYLEAHSGAWQAFPDVAPALAELAQAGIGLGVITNGVEELQRQKLDRMGLTGHFRAVVCADTAGAGKPDPRIFHAAARQMGVDPQMCWHVGDQVHADALGAAAGGMRPLLVDRRGAHRDQQDVRVIGGLGDLVGLVTAPELR
ncbi:HAD family hydrolase [Nocardiopsis suaedae]|uniref:HAD family hydrolase n=1 Tax=Nocardiopsis suaedae TaxID=3018444 RepID=A0ABT4TGX1_9ACTN|nr:HAD family hydrolase [Nocardiopsis suaedae]MDA2803906.1 HAD family hydrolase [Nocardiopsis suaedae]